MLLSRTDMILSWVKGPGVLDVGCTGHSVDIGSPRWLHGRLREQFPSVVGIDLSAENIAALRRHGFANLHVQSAESFVLPDEFDTIVAGEIIEHLANPGLFLQQARKHLKPAGRLVLTTPHPFSLANIAYALTKYPKTCQNAEHACWFCPRTMTELVKRNGLRIEHFELIDDYSPDIPSLRYRAFIALRRGLGFLLPRLLAKNAMLFVLTPGDGAAGDTAAESREKR